MLFVKTQMNIQLSQGSLPFIEPKVNLNLQIILSDFLVSHNNNLYAHMFVFYCVVDKQRLGLGIVLDDFVL